MTKGQALSNATHIGFFHQGRLAQSAAALRVLAREQVALPLAITLYLAGGGYFKPL
jgi:hypothetical protein